MTIIEYWTHEIMNGLNGFDDFTNEKHIKEVLNRAIPDNGTKEDPEKQEKFQHYLEELAKRTSLEPAKDEDCEFYRIRILNKQLSDAKISNLQPPILEFHHHLSIFDRIALKSKKTINYIRDWWIKQRDEYKDWDNDKVK